MLHSIHVGFGLLDCTRLVIFAKSWKPVGRLCISNSGNGKLIKVDWASRQAAVPESANFRNINTSEEAQEFLEKIQNMSRYEHIAELKAGYETVVRLNVTSNIGITEGLPKNDACKVETVEKVVVQIQWEQLCRGLTVIWLESPGRTQTTLLNSRLADYYNGPVSTTFTSVAHLGEPMLGEWSIGLFSNSIRGISIYPPTRKFPIFAHPHADIDIDTRHLLKQFDLKRSCKNTVINELQDPLRGVVYHVDLKFWGTEESNSAYTKNKEMLEPTLSPLAIKARKTRRGKKLEQAEVLEVFNFQREWAYNFTNSQLEKMFPSPKNND
ncbi:hypothetical protein D915_006293 [Fasciola hepatica]|uniref:P/Homo B domain-containing protein n=1 Tax=Fasciola hepatica TaxID=6192 RepID=A0A4E0R564_FASHE|nr:hypothetical protein D915_006293 [Fasciola hepatica]